MKPARSTSGWIVGGALRRAVMCRVLLRTCSATAAAMILAIATGCSWVDDKGQRRHLVLGLGVISTGRDAAGANGESGDASVERIRATGLFLGAGPVVNGLMFGWANVQTVRIDSDAEVLIEACARADGTLSVRAESLGTGGGEGDGEAQKGNEYP